LVEGGERVTKMNGMERDEKRMDGIESTVQRVNCERGLRSKIILKKIIK
jgi:hypothetical protein